MRTKGGLRGGFQTAAVADPPPQLPHVVPHHEELVPLPLSVPEHLPQQGRMRLIVFPQAMQAQSAGRCCNLQPPQWAAPAAECG